MLGIACRFHQRPVVEEFFQLFKVPWEYVQPGKSYDALIVTDNLHVPPDVKLIIISSPRPVDLDRDYKVKLTPGRTSEISLSDERHLPVYTNLSCIVSPGEPFAWSEGGIPAGIRGRQGEMAYIRIGYDLFDEVQFLLTTGQPPEKAAIPTLDYHIAAVRDWILSAGLPLFEIPPFPPGYEYIACLTHDVDFLGIRDHFFDRTMAGFIARAVRPPGNSSLVRRETWRRYARNLKALVSLPFVYLGLARDFWFQLDRYLGLEKDMPSTFYFIPQRGKPGTLSPGKISVEAPGHRAIKYGQAKLKAGIELLLINDREVGVHGLDSWHDLEKAREEIEAIRSITGQQNIGIRMHWLYFSSLTAKVLGSAGYRYDSTVGYNDAVGFRAGTAQVYELPGSMGVMELPMHIQDSAMFYSGRMGIYEEEAFNKCENIINNVSKFGGALTINWHQRSLAPERNWDVFYQKLLKRLNENKVWFATAMHAVEWFAARRELRFERVDYRQKEVTLTINGNREPFENKVNIQLHNSGGKGSTVLEKCVEITRQKRIEMNFALEDRQ
ncbi:MAG: hypothetical protein RRA15_09535 [bacterium]|nr:hypothetical protein [bacterium]